MGLVQMINLGSSSLRWVLIDIAVLIYANMMLILIENVSLKPSTSSSGSESPVSGESFQLDINVEKRSPAWGIAGAISVRNDMQVHRVYNHLHLQRSAVLWSY